MLNNDLPQSKIVGFIGYAIGVSFLLLAIATILDNYQSSSPHYTGGIVCFLVGGVAIFLGYGMIQFQPWARTGITIIIFFTALFAVFAAIGMVMNNVEGSTSFQDLLYGLVFLSMTVAILGGLLLLLYNKTINEELNEEMKKEEYEDILDHFNQ